MISISINGHELVIPSDTAVTLEQSAPWADLDNISSDIVWTFSLPASPNAAILDQAHHVVVAQRRQYDCTVSFGGTPIANGQLYIQQSDNERHLSCGVTFNVFGAGWGAKRLCDNDLGNDFTIATSIDTHQQQWMDFLRDTLDDDSIVKFFPFIDTRFYSDNDDFGQHDGHAAPLENRSGDNLETHIVNRLFVDDSSSIINLDNTLDGVSNLQGLQIFNEFTELGAKNGYTFAPAIRLDRMLMMILPAHIGVKGTFFTSRDVARLYMQSMTALDDDVYQYGLTNFFQLGRGLVPGIETSDVSPIMPVTFNGNQDYTSFSLVSRLTIPSASFLVTPDLDDIQGDMPVTDTFFDSYDECYMFVFIADGAAIPQSLYRLPSNGGDPRYYGTICSVAEILAQTGEIFDNPHDVAIRYDAGNKRWYVSAYNGGINTPHEYPIDSPLKMAGVFMMQLTDTATLFVDYADSLSRSYLQGSLTLDQLCIYGSTDTQWSVALVKAKVYRSDDGAGMYPGSGVADLSNAPLEMVQVVSVLDTNTVTPADNALNIYANRLRWREHVPDMTNGELLKAVCQMFGLTMWTGGMDSTVQLDFFSDIYRADVLPIDDIVVSTRKTTYAPKRYDITVASVIDSSDVSERLTLPDVATREQLPPAQRNKGRNALIASENIRMSSIKDGNTDTYSWQQGGGNASVLHVGEFDMAVEEVQPGIKVPNMTIADEAHTPKYLMQIESQGCSPLLDRDYSGKFGPILVQYRGRKKIKLQSSAADGRATYTSEAYIEAANPTCYNSDGSVEDESISLTATGDKSIGEMWQRPLYEFLANSQEVEFDVLLTHDQFLRVNTLMRVQDGPIAKQTRWLSYKSQHYLPTKITYELGRGDIVKATIIARRRMFEEE